MNSDQNDSRLISVNNRCLLTIDNTNLLYPLTNQLPTHSTTNLLLRTRSKIFNNLIEVIPPIHQEVRQCHCVYLSVFYLY